MMVVTLHFHQWFPAQIFTKACIGVAESSFEEVRKATREQIKNGADVIKLGVTGAVLVEDGVPGATHFNADEIRVAVEEAAKFGKRVAAHAHGIDGIRKAVQAGVAFD